MVTQAQTTPAESGTSGWWPSKYGAEDQAGALNEITPGKILEAVRLVRKGRVYDLAHVLHQDIPAFPGRTSRQYLTINYHQINRRRPGAGPAGLGRDSVNWIVEQVTATQQMGTHMDGLNQLQAGDRTYNGFLPADIVEVRDQAHLYGLLDRLRDLGIELLAVEPAGAADAGPGRGTALGPAT
jgi:hypothetical protein